MSTAPRDPDRGARTDAAPGFMEARPRLQWLAAQGTAGAVLALLLLRIEAVAPLAAVKSKLFPLVLLVCAEASWLFGGGVGLLLAAQWLIHELAHVRAAQAIGLRPGWMSFVPFTGVYAGTTPRDFGSREREALVALAGVLAGLCAAIGLLAAGQFLGSEAAILSAKFGFALTLANLLPFRPFDGGRIFPGALWRYRADQDAAVDPASVRLIAACRMALRRVMPGIDKADGRTIVAEALVAMILAQAIGVGLAALLLPPMALAVTIIVGIAMTCSLFAAVIALDPRALAVTGPEELAPRRFVRPGTAGQADATLPWADPKTPRVALAIYALAVLAASVGCVA